MPPGTRWGKVPDAHSGNKVRAPKGKMHRGGDQNGTFILGATPDPTWSCQTAASATSAASSEI